MNPIPRLFVLLLAVGLLAAPFHAQRTRSRGGGGGAARGFADRIVDRIDVEFTLVHDLPNTRRAVYLTGDLPELGGGDPTRSLRMISDDRLNWRLAVALPPGTTYEFQYLNRKVRPNTISDPLNFVILTQPAEGRTPRVRSGEAGKLIRMNSSFLRPLLHWREVGGEMESLAMTEVGPGRVDGESQFEARGFGNGGRRIEFFMTDGPLSDRRGTQARAGAGSLTGPGAKASSGGSAGRDPAVGLYSTPLARVFVQDGELFTYVPAPTVGALRRDYDPAAPPTFPSSILNQVRPYRVLLPRGYDEHADRRYPVLYLVDGQVAWDNGGSWDQAGSAMANLVSRGEVGEAILVGIEGLGAGCTLTRNRFRDCVSPEDSLTLTNNGCTGFVTGRVDRFLTFIVSELKPAIDATYRTLPDREHTFASGFSLGGVYALYAAWEFPQVFGAVGSQSGSFWLTNFPARVIDEPHKNVRLYFDFGDQEVNAIFATVRGVRDGLLDLDSGYVLERDLRLEIGFGHAHTFPNAGARMEPMMTFMWPATRRVSELK